MIYYVSGSVSILEPGLAVIDCGGVGYGCRISAYTSAQLKLNTTARLLVTESIREDAHDLYGFSSKEEQRCFELLTAINGVGPKAALSILSAGGPQNFTLAVMTGDEKMLVAAQGVGKKLAQRIILELKDRWAAAAWSWTSPPVCLPPSPRAAAIWRWPPPRCKSWATPPLKSTQP